MCIWRFSNQMGPIIWLISGCERFFYEAIFQLNMIKPRSSISQCKFALKIWVNQTKGHFQLNFEPANQRGTFQSLKVNLKTCIFSLEKSQLKLVGQFHTLHKEYPGISYKCPLFGEYCGTIHLDMSNIPFTFLLICWFWTSWVVNFLDKHLTMLV